MSDIPSSDPMNLQDAIARIDRAQAETRKFVAEANKFAAEQNKLSAEAAKMAAEQIKLSAEAAKFARERGLLPWTLGLAAAGALAGIFAGVVPTLLRMLGAP